MFSGLAQEIPRSLIVIGLGVYFRGSPAIPEGN